MSTGWHAATGGVERLQTSLASAEATAAEIQHSLKRLERHDWKLWTSAVVILLLLAAVVFALSFPSFVHRHEIMTPGQLDVAVRALLGLVMVFSSFVLAQQFAIRELRHRLGEQVERLSSLQLQAEAARRPKTGTGISRAVDEAEPKISAASQPALSIFHDVAKALTSSLKLNSVLQTIMEIVAEHFRPDTWSLLMVDDNSRELYFAIAVGDAAEKLRTVRLKIGEGIAGWVAEKGEPLLVPDVSNDPRFARRVDNSTQFQTHSIICLPLRCRETVLGVIQLVNVPVEHFSDKEMPLLQTLCDYAAIAIDNARTVERMREFSITDDLTGLHNRRFIMESLPAEIARSMRHRQPFSVLIMDLDDFKQINDLHGHAAGDRALEEFARTLRRAIRNSDLPARIGGDEFLVLLPDCDYKQASIPIGRMACGIEWNGIPLSVRFTPGWAQYQNGESAQELLKRADEMLYANKRARKQAPAPTNT